MVFNQKQLKIMGYMMSVSFLFIHIVMFSMFYKNHVMPMVYVNIFSIIFYALMPILVYKDMLMQFSLFIMIEVDVHMFLAIIFTGWEAGFQITLVGMLILAFYSEYTGRSQKIKYLKNA